mmetsp:Transcript_20542/g.49404  ORF Transcript_20542/g.49404 Transcript_20542/m.49404 type:complete len:800 (+) Transcript_20542:307-2706(+)
MKRRSRHHLPNSVPLSYWSSLRRRPCCGIILLPSLLILLLLLQQPTPVLSACNVTYSGECFSENRTVDSTITFEISDDTEGSNVGTFYNADVTFHWGTSTLYWETIQSNKYSTGDEMAETSSYTYGKDGAYYVGYTVIFREGSGVGCEGMEFTEYFVLTFDDDRRECGFVSYKGVIVPTMMVTERPTTAPPSKRPTTPLPTTSPPSKNPTLPATTAATTPSPTVAQTTSKPFDLALPKPLDLALPNPYDGGDEIEDNSGGGGTTSAPTIDSIRPTTRPPTPSPAAVVPPSRITPAPATEEEVGIIAPIPTAGPQVASSSSSLLPVRRYEVSSTMVLYHSDLLDNMSKLKAWEEVTRRTICRGVVSSAAMTTDARDGCEGDGGGSDGVAVIVRLDEQNALAAPSTRRRRRRLSSYLLRSLRSESSSLSRTPLEIIFTTSMDIPYENDDGDDWDAEGMVAAGFDTPEKRDQYLVDLKGYDGDNGGGGNENFEGLERLGLEVENNTIVAPWADPSAVVEADDEGRIESTGDDDDDENLSLIVGAAVGGGCLFLLVSIMGAYHLPRRKNLRRNEGTESATSSDAGATKRDERRDDVAPYGGSYFGTIESREGEGFDDVSTLGDPYMGDAVDAVMDTDNTVGESMVSSQQELYVWKFGKPQTGMDAASRMGGSTIYSGSKTPNMIFGDDTTLEDAFHANEDGNGRNDASFRRMTVIAPAGKLGIVLDNPNGELPAVYAIKETSALHGRVRVGDLLLSVDGFDCAGMTAQHVSKFLSQRGDNPARTLVFARGSGRANGTVTVSAC